jgi:CRP/FNR family transcriptional regulator, cyclic AMP receptor protein
MPMMPTAPGAKPDRAAFLARTSIFADLDQHELSHLAQRAVTKKYAPGEAIFHTGDPCPGLHIVETGAVRIFKTSLSGREQVLGIDGPGSSVAELPVFDGGPYPASAAAIQESTLLFISKQDFQAVCLEYPKVALKVLRVIGRRLRGLVAIIEELSFTTVRHRLIAMLLRLAKEGQKTQQGIVVTLPASNQELASQIGTVRELVSRNMSRLQAEGLIHIEGRQITMPSVRKLEEEVEGGE